MPTLSEAAQARLSVAAAAIGGVAAIALMREVCFYYRDAAEVKSPRPKTRRITQRTEDALVPSTLNTLLSSTNSAIRDTASKIIIDRSLHDEYLIECLLWEITHTDYDRRTRGLRALNFLWSNWDVPFSDQPLSQPRVFSALITSLTRSLHDVEPHPFDSEWDNYYFRDASERLPLELLTNLVNAFKFRVEEVIRYKFVSRWLAKQLMGDTREEIYKNMSILATTNESPLGHLVRVVNGIKAGHEQLVEAGLWPENPKDTRVWTNQLPDYISRASDQLPPVPRTTRRLTGGNTGDLEQLRRRNREAMVFNNGEQPLSRDDVFERGDGGSGDQRAEFDHVLQNSRNLAERGDGDSGDQRAELDRVLQNLRNSAA